MNKTGISVILPVYNSELYLERAIESILKQTLTEFELIIINDGSTDSSESIIINYKDSRIRYIKQENTGVGEALRNGCKLAIGNYIARMDADDICFPHRLEIQKAYLDHHPKAVLVSNAVIYIDVSGNYIGRSFPYTSNYAINKLLKIGSPICHPSVMMRRNVYEATGGYEKLKLLEDLFLWIKLSKLGSLHNIRTPLIKYRVINNSVSRSITKEHYKILIQLLNEMATQNIINDNTIGNFNRLFEKAEEETKLLKNIEIERKVINKLNFNSKAESEFYKTLQKLKLSEPIIEYIICNIKNTLTYFRNKKI